MVYLTIMPPSHFDCAIMRHKKAHPDVVFIEDFD